MEVDLDLKWKFLFLVNSFDLWNMLSERYFFPIYLTIFLIYILNIRSLFGMRSMTANEYIFNYSSRSWYERVLIIIIKIYFILKRF